MKVLFIGFVWPELTSTAASQNIMSYLKAFNEHGYELHFASAALRSVLSTNLDVLDVTCHQTQLNCDSFDALVKDIAPDIVVFDRFLSEEQFSWRVMKAAPNALRILDIEDLHFVRHARHTLYKKTGYQPKDAVYLECDSILQEQYQELLHNEICSREMASIYRSDLVLSLSEFERSLLIERFHVPAEHVLHIPYLLPNTDIFSSDIRQDFVSIGNFRHAPNIDAVNILIQHIWPRIAKRLPGAKCHIYGSYLPPRIKDLHNPKKGLYIHGHVQDHHKMLRQAKVLLAPIQFGAGVKGKIVDALRCGLPSITTPIGAEGIKYDVWPGAIVKNQEDFIDSAVATFQSVHNFIPEARAILDMNFVPEQHSSDLITAVKSALNSLTGRRSKHFLQQMVSHHSLQTHQYMSQWIAAKNAHRKD